MCGISVKTTTSARETVFSKGGTIAQGESAPFALTPEELNQLAPNLDKLRVSLVLENASEAFEAKPVIQTSEDGINWITTATQPSLGWTGSAGVSTSVWWTAVDELKRAIRIGVIARQSGGTQIEMGLVRIMVDWQTK